MYRVRKALKFTQGNKKEKEYIKKAVTADNATNIKFLHIMVFKVEAHWAYGMMRKNLLKQEEHAENSRLKFHFKKRFQLAYKAAKELQAVATDRLDAYSQIEVDAYVAQIGA